VCPVYERTGGHAYGSIYPGPIGAVLSPQMTGLAGPDDVNATLPYASSLCGACFDACPVRIDIPSLLVQQRAAAVQAHTRPTGQDVAMQAAAIAMTTPGRFKLAERALGAGRVLAGRKGRISTLPWPLSGWTNARDVPAPPKETFRAWWARTHGGA
jgi:L-lactate dehydrogenase complex protein LldF